MYGLGKDRTNLGKWLDKRGIKQEWLANKSKLGRTTISNACSDADYVPSGKSMQKIMRALREVDPSVTSNQFWGI